MQLHLTIQSPIASTYLSKSSFKKKKKRYINTNQIQHSIVLYGISPFGQITLEPHVWIKGERIWGEKEWWPYSLLNFKYILATFPSTLQSLPSISFHSKLTQTYYTQILYFFITNLPLIIIVLKIKNPIIESQFMYYCNKEWNIVEFVATHTLTLLHHPHHPHGLHTQIIKESVIDLQLSPILLQIIYKWCDNKCNWYHFSNKMNEFLNYFLMIGKALAGKIYVIKM